MPKQKTHSGAKKRFRKTGSGAIKCRTQFRSHILTKKTPKWKRQARANMQVDVTDEKRINRLLVEVCS